MKRPFDPISQTVRAVSAAIAFAVTLLVGGLVDNVADHYYLKALAEATPPAIVAQQLPHATTRTAAAIR